MFCMKDLGLMTSFFQWSKVLVLVALNTNTNLVVQLAAAA